MEVDETLSHTPTMNATTYSEIDGKRRKLMTNNSDYNQQINCENLKPTILNFPLVYLTDDHIIQALLDVSEDDELFVKIWLTYCNNMPLKNSLRKVYHDHCYSDIPKRDCTDSVVSAETNITDCIGVDNSKTNESSQTVRSSKETDSKTIVSDPDSQSESSFLEFWDREGTLFLSDTITEPVESMDSIKCSDMYESYGDQPEIDCSSESSSIYNYVDPYDSVYSSDIESEPEDLSDSGIAESHERQRNFYCASESGFWNTGVSKKTTVLQSNKKSEQSRIQNIILPKASQCVR